MNAKTGLIEINRDWYNNGWAKIDAYLNTSSIFDPELEALKEELWDASYMVNTRKAVLV
jgi:hypothetical protein